jgi:hypothetical protein
MAKRVPKKVQHKLKNNNMKNQDLIQKAADEISSFEQVIVKADNGAMRRFYVKKKEDVIEKAEDYSKMTAEQHEKKAQSHRLNAEALSKFRPDKDEEKIFGNTDERIANHKKQADIHSKLAKEKASK